MGDNPQFTVGTLLQADIDFASILQRQIGRPAFVQVEQAFFKALARLRIDAREAGEPQYRLHAMKMTVMALTVPPLYITYGVHEEQHVVVVRRILMI